ncbi:MAG: fatty acid hydroxylase [Porticoccaceae bacterium]|nr:fatty acid hydroxylase [Porticoccaceae bacterium]|tara:strand:+ start:2928 stop:3842 length:915 start_codon:yes stop_codon:yes gene_type:complete
MIIDWLFEPAQFFLDPAKRVYWLYLLSALVVASLAVTYQEGRFQPLEQLRSLVNLRYWLSKSSLYDLFLMIFNSVIRLGLLIPLFGSHLAVTVLVGGFLQETFGDAPNIGLDWIWIAVIFSSVFLLADDLSRFGLHYCMHHFEFLWYFHRTHHSATVLTPMTVFRVHPIEHLLYFSRSFLVFGTVTGVFIWLFSQHLTGLQILGVDAFGFLFNFAAANLRHSHIWISFGPFERLFISPAQHQMHHSVDHGNINFGSILSIWDGWLGTRVYAEKKIDMRFGINDESVSESRLRTDNSNPSSEVGV